MKRVFSADCHQRMPSWWCWEFLASLVGCEQVSAANGLNLGLLLGFSALIGFGGAFISAADVQSYCQVVDWSPVIEAARDPGRELVGHQVCPPRMRAADARSGDLRR